VYNIAEKLSFQINIGTNDLGGIKYSTRPGDPRVERVLNSSGPDLDLIAAAYADSTWDRLVCVLNTLEKCEKDLGLRFSWPFDDSAIANFIKWSSLVKKHSPSTTATYLSMIKIIHELRKINSSACSSFISKTLLRGAENLRFYEPHVSQNKKVMTLPLLEIIGHEIANENWCEKSKSVVWTALLVGFWGSFRFGELLSKDETNFHVKETLLWSDIKFVECDSVIIHNKIPKNRTPNGEFVSLFEYRNVNCCPVKALQFLKSLSDVSKNGPVFEFDSGNFLTCKKLNAIILHTLKKHIGNEAKAYSCRSFRAALPSALAAKPMVGNKENIKRWGRWNSDAYERYTRLSHRMKRRLFYQFVAAIDDM
jgi:hypothetical protein